MTAAAPHAAAGIHPPPVDLRSLSHGALSDLLQQRGERPYRADQLFRAMHAQGVQDLGEVTTLPKALRASLAEEVPLGGLTLLRTLRSQEDGSVKLVLSTGASEVLESVIIPAEDGRVTQCVSSQVGCKIGCSFCCTATMALRRNLRPSEIVDQVYHARRLLDPLGERITNLVFMGMGEPLDNLDAVTESCDLLMDQRGQNMSARRITISTSGLVPRIRELGERSPVDLAVSLNATTDEVRDKLIPINRRWPIAELLQALKGYPLDRRRRITIEYVLLRDVNDTTGDARRLVRLLRGMRVKVNLIPFNPWPGAPYDQPTEPTVDAFCQVLSRAHMSVTVRRSRGRDIGAACGMLDGRSD